MPNLIIALIVVFGGIWLIRKFARMNKAAVPGFTQKLAGGAIIAFSGLLALRGSMNAAVPVFLFGLGLFGKGAAFPNGFGWGSAKSPGQKSRVATSMLAMELDHDTGQMDGEVLSGPFKGRKLNGLTLTELQSFHAACCAATDQSASLCEAWLDRAQPSWREEWGTRGNQKAKSEGNMSRDEAFAVLGLKDGATESEIRAAHKRLMKDFHPDRGGSDYIAAKVNAAKDVLLSPAAR